MVLLTKLPKIGISVVGVVLALVVVVAALSWSGLLGKLDLFETRTVDRSQPVLLTSIQDISQYHAAIGNFEVVIDSEKDVSWVPSFIAGERSLFIAAGAVNAYVDFGEMGEDDLSLSEDGSTVQIRLPQAQLDKPNLDQDRTYLFSQSRGITNRVWDSLSTKDQSDLYKQAVKKLATAANASGLIEQATENTKAMLIGMYHAADLKVTFRDALPAEEPVPNE